uniref:Steroid 5-alpha reductase C-terminal domain-containing protein n=1 Tax=Biomphalaria glabrata TaxID=6526 RepID=A0A2C9KFZ6_BIOGL
MANRRGNIRLDDIIVPSVSLRWLVASILFMFLAPVFLIFLVLRCEKNQCMLLQLPMVIPTLPNVYFSMFSFYVVIGYILIVLLLAITHVPAVSYTENQAFSSMVTCITVLLVTYYLNPSLIKLLHSEYLRLLCVTTVLCYFLSFVFYILGRIGISTKDRDFSWPAAIFYGNTISIKIGDLDLKYFFYVYAGMIGWVLLDMIIFLNMILEHKWNSSVIFLTITQSIFIAYTLYNEQFMQRKPFVKYVGLGFLWLMRVLMFLPFLHSLPVYFAATTEMRLPKPLILLAYILYLFGLIMYISCTQQKEGFQNEKLIQKAIRTVSVGASSGKRFLVSGYWGIVQKPDYVAYMIIWFSWTMACGLSNLSVIILLLMYGSVLVWLQQTTYYKQHTMGNNVWDKYETAVPKKLIPFIY